MHGTIASESGSDAEKREPGTAVPLTTSGGDDGAPLTLPLPLPLALRLE